MKRSLGTCYYPEHWPEAQWDEDAARMVELGLSWVRIGEFAWTRMEPTPGDLQLDWLDRAFDVLGGVGLKVVLGTPTATPPRWMLDKHPDMLAVDADGRPRGFGSRRHYCFSHDGYRAEAVRITEILARRYGRNPHLGAWQTDNEYGCHDTVVSYSGPALQAFRDWLAQRYQSIEALNRAWGNIFWSMAYGSFDEIGLPNLTVTEPNPAHVMDFRRFSSAQVALFNRVKVAAIRACSDAPISHNYMGGVTEFDHFALGQQMEIATWDSYPLGFLQDRVGASDADKIAYARQGDPDYQAFHHDLYRAVGQGRWWVMEQQPGPVNWAPVNTIPLPGMVRLWTWEAFAHGAECVSYFRWRQAPFAQEQMHTGLLRPDSAEAPAFAEAAQVAAELAAWPEVAHGASPVALIFDYQSCWSWDVQPQGKQCHYLRLVLDVYSALRRQGVSVDILPPQARDFADHKLVLVPGLEMLPDGLADALAASEATVCLGPRTGSKTHDFAIPADLPPDLPGLDAKVVRVETLPPEITMPAGDGATQAWREELETGAEVLIADANGHPVLIRGGGLHYLSGWPDRALARQIVGLLAADAGVQTHTLPEGVRLREAGGQRFLFNHNAHAVTVDGVDVEPAGIILGF